MMSNSLPVLPSKDDKVTPRYNCRISYVMHKNSCRQDYTCIRCVTRYFWFEAAYSMNWSPPWWLWKVFCKWSTEERRTSRNNNAMKEAVFWSFRQWYASSELVVFGTVSSIGTTASGRRPELSCRGLDREDVKYESRHETRVGRNGR